MKTVFYGVGLVVHSLNVGLFIEHGRWGMVAEGLAIWLALAWLFWRESTR
jgi:hypothetical protein